MTQPSSTATQQMPSKGAFQVGDVWAVLVAGGSGSRYSVQKPKLLEPLEGKPVFTRSFEVLYHLSSLAGVVIVFHPQLEEVCRASVQPLITEKPVLWETGGDTRRASVWRGLSALPDSARIVLIHDAARPLVQPDRIEAAIEPVRSGLAPGTTLGIPSQNTLKQVSSKNGDPWVEKTLDRSRIWQVHTPQVFRKEVLVEAHQAVSNHPPVNDDAELLERLDPERPMVLMVADSPSNIKITTPFDLQLARIYLNLLLSDPSVSISCRT